MLSLLTLLLRISSEVSCCEVKMISSYLESQSGKIQALLLQLNNISIIASC